MITTYLKSLMRKPLFIFVGLPTLVIGFYSAILASDEIAASATAIVKENNESTGPEMPGFASAVFNYGSSTSLEDAYLLESYLTSEDFILKMNESLELDKHFSSAGFFLFQRLSPRANADTLYSYLVDHLSVRLSIDSSIITLKFRSFDPSYSKKALNYIIKEAEAKINDLSQRMSDSYMSLAWRQLERSEAELRAANQAILDFQTKNGWLNESEITTEFTQIETLRGRIIESQVERQTLLQSMRPETPKIQNLDTKIEAMKMSLTELQGKLLKDESGSSITLANEFSRLSLELEFSQNKYAASTSAFEQAQKEASQQHKFLLLISPVIAESVPAAPKPLESTMTTFIVSLLAYLVIRLVVLTIRDHTV